MVQNALYLCIAKRVTGHGVYSNNIVKKRLHTYKTHKCAASLSGKVRGVYFPFPIIWKSVCIKQISRTYSK